MSFIFINDIYRRSYQFQFSPNFHCTSFSRADLSKNRTSPILKKLFRVRISLRLTVHATVVFKESSFVILAFLSSLKIPIAGLTRVVQFFFRESHGCDAHICSSVHGVISRGRRKSGWFVVATSPTARRNSSTSLALSAPHSLPLLLFHGLARGILSAVPEKLTGAERSSGI